MEIRELAQLVARTRGAEQSYFSRRDPQLLAEARALEARLDEALRDLPPSPLADLAGRMRAAQRAFSRPRSTVALAEAKAIEARVDRMLRALLDQPRLFADDDGGPNPADRIVRDLARS